MPACTQAGRRALQYTDLSGDLWPALCRVCSVMGTTTCFCSPARRFWSGSSSWRCARKSLSLDAILTKGQIDIAVLCHSVPDAECEEVMHRLREHSHGVKVLVLYESMPDLCSSHSDEAMENLEGPSSLLHKLHELMEEAAHDKARHAIAIARGHGVICASNAPSKAKWRSRVADCHSSPSERT